MIDIVETDIAIIGGGIAGLWLLNQLRKQGYSAILFDGETIGGGQTVKSQGIIHGGIKYALQGKLTQASNAIRDMPARWKKCLEGNGEIDLSAVPILSSKQYLWAPGGLAGKIGGLFAGLLLNEKLTLLDKQDYPDIFRHPQFKGQVYLLDEIVLDVYALLRELVKPNQDAIFKIDPLTSDNLKFDSTGNLDTITLSSKHSKTTRIKAKKYIFTAGAGNEVLLHTLHGNNVAMQRRPLHMVLMKAKFLYPLYAHCLGINTVPRLTITSHQTEDNHTAWYIGGQIAEEGVKRDQASQIQTAKNELKELFPWIDFSDAEFTSFIVERAEGLQPNGKRPDTYIINEIANMIIAWPTKLALAPKLADDIVNLLQKDNFLHNSTLRPLRSWPIPAIAKPVWEELL